MHRIFPGYCGFCRIQLSMSAFSCLARSWKTNSSVFISSTYNKSSIIFRHLLTSPVLQRFRDRAVPRSYYNGLPKKLHLLVSMLTSYLKFYCLKPKKKCTFQTCSLTLRKSDYRMVSKSAQTLVYELCSRFSISGI